MTTYTDAVFISTEMSALRAKAEAKKVLVPRAARFWSQVLILLGQLKVPGEKSDGTSHRCCRKEQWTLIKKRIQFAAFMSCFVSHAVDVSELQKLINEASLDAN